MPQAFEATVADQIFFRGCVRIMQNKYNQSLYMQYYIKVDLAQVYQYIFAFKKSYIQYFSILSINSIFLQINYKALLYIFAQLRVIRSPSAPVSPFRSL
ncbi:hypothetical protein FGO68_gene11520 [Halteria grandinella]|uniref:Uncharacterized protein n=1 Tax=Halteria grandinella TaxID=5974 RepID=A0A8J8NIJ7_HALGN|nr:hypothetical protein FGO68_gene11520 [Halteria grandinella]